MARFELNTELLLNKNVWFGSDQHWCHVSILAPLNMFISNHFHLATGFPLFLTILIIKVDSVIITVCVTAGIQSLCLHYKLTSNKFNLGHYISVEPKDSYGSFILRFLFLPPLTTPWAVRATSCAAPTLLAWLSHVCVFVGHWKCTCCATLHL